MRRVTTTLAAIVTMALLGVVLGAWLGSPATADDKADKKAKGISVGLRPATKTGGDTSRSVLEYEIPPRGTIVDYVAVSNLQTTPITVRLFTKDATTTTGSPYAVQESDVSPTDIGSWMSLKKNKITLPPRSETVVPFQLGVPYNASPGDHSGAIVVSLLAREAKPEGGTIVVDHRVGLRVLARVPGDYKPALTISNIKASWDSPGSLLGRGKAVVTYTVRNTGNLRLSATQDLKLTRSLGLPPVDAKVPPIGEIQPGGEIRVRQVVPNVFGTGPMKAQVTLRPQTVDKKLKDIPVKDTVTTTSFSAWPWLLIVTIVLLLLIIGLGVHFERKRRKARQAAMAPTGGKYRSPLPPDARPDADKVLTRIGVGAVVAVLALLGLAGPASADGVDVWQGKLSVQQGTDGSPFDMITTGGCPLPGTNVVGFAYGKGFPKEGGVAVGNGDAGVEARGAFRMPIAETMQQLMAEQPNPATLSGVYKIELRCVSEDLQKVTGKYVFAIRFTDPKHWKAEPPLTTAKGPVTTGSEDGTDPSSDPTGATAQGGPGAATSPGSSQTPGSGASPGQGELDAAAEKAAELSGIEEAKKSNSKSDPNWLLIGGGFVVLAGSGFLLFRRSKA